jgi:hypothetical protein
MQAGGAEVGRRGAVRATAPGAHFIHAHLTAQQRRHIFNASHPNLELNPVRARHFGRYARADRSSGVRTL